MINLITCMGKNNEIGLNNDMPWGRGLPEDLKYFKEKTLNKTVIMGRKTFDSILTSLGKPLPKRNNVVLTKQIFRSNYSNVSSCNSVEEVLDKYKGEDIFIIGGASIYEQFLPYANRLFITEIEEVFEADTFFPKIDLKEWKKTYSLKGYKDNKNLYNYCFDTYTKI